MRVLQVHNRYRDPGGEDTSVAAEAELLRIAGHEVVSYTVDNPRGAARAAAGMATAAWNPRAAKKLERFAARVAPDVTHVHNTWFALSPAAVHSLKQAGTPVVVTLHNYRLVCANALLFREGAPCELCVGSQPWHAIRYRCYRQSRPASAVAATTIAINRARGTWDHNVDAFVALTDFAKRRFVAAGLPGERITVKPHFVFDPGPRPAPPSDSNVVLYVGRLSPEKGLTTLLAAWRQAKVDALKLRIIGDGPLRPTLEAAADASVEFTGTQPPTTVRKEMLGARALVFPSEWYETQGMVLLEAFSAGLPAMASDLGAAGEVMSDVDAQWRREPSDERGWAEGLRTLLDGAGVDDVGEHVRTLWADRFSPARARASLLAIYERARASQ